MMEIAQGKLSMGPDMLHNAYSAVRFLAMACGFEKHHAMVLLGVEHLPIGDIGVHRGFNHATTTIPRAGTKARDHAIGQ